MKLLKTIPAMPVRDIARSVAFHRDTLGLTLGYHNDGFAKFPRDSIELHLWAASDEAWKTRGPK